MSPPVGWRPYTFVPTPPQTAEGTGPCPANCKDGLGCEKMHSSASSAERNQKPVQHRSILYRLRTYSLLFLAFVLGLASCLMILVWLNKGLHLAPHRLPWMSYLASCRSLREPLRSNLEPDDFVHDDRTLGTIPQYVFEHAPLVHLYSREEFWPCKMPDHLHHVTPYHNYEPLPSTRSHYNLTNLDELNRDGRFVYLQSSDDVEDRPRWLSGRKNIPKTVVNLDDSSRPNMEELDHHDNTGQDIQAPIERAREDVALNPEQQYPGNQPIEQYNGGHSSAPAVLVTIDKGDGIVDAFWFFFYCYNLGNKVLNIRFGNHVGDWEHTLVRFKDGKPHEVFFSEHSWGEAYSWDAVEKYGQRVRVLGIPCLDCINVHAYKLNDRTIARRILCGRYSRYVRDTRHASIYPSTRPSSR